jgi:hypothetical protein
MGNASITRTILEPARETKVCWEADVVIVGAGPGGVAAALAAARSGAETVIIERYGHLGGMATGGLINIIPNLSDISGKQHIAGICQEIVDRMDARDAAHYPKKEEWGTADPEVVERYLDAAMPNFYIRKDLNTGKDRVLYTVLLDPEVLKDELNKMMEEAKVKLYLHSWCTQPVMDGNTIKGVIIENKSGRQAILGKVIIDSTGDGDVMVGAGVEYDSRLNPKLRTAKLAMAFWLANVDVKRRDEFKATQPQKYEELLNKLAGMGGFTRYFKDLLKNQGNVLWSHPMYPSTDGTNVEELIKADTDLRRRILISWEYLKKHIPGFEKCFIMTTSPQLGTQGGPRVIGEYVLTEKDMESDEIFEDTIAVFANNDSGQISAKHPSVCIPYRSLVPRQVEGLLVACRAFSSSDVFNSRFNIIPHCLCFGQAAGTAAAMAADGGISVRRVNYKALQNSLRKQGVIIPAEEAMMKN